MKKKGFNWKAREAGEVKIDNSTVKNIDLHIKYREDEYDACNVLALPSKKRKTENKAKGMTVTRFLSKKKRKQLEKIAEKKKKKQNRAALENNLAQVSVSQEELKKYVSLTTVQTKGLKRYLRESEISEANNEAGEYNDQNDVVIKTLKGAKKRRLALVQEAEAEKVLYDPTVLGLDERSESDDSSYEGDKSQIESSIPEVILETEKTKDVVSCEKKSAESQNKTEGTKVSKKDDVEVIEVERKPAVFVSLSRKPEIQEARLKLPILAEEQGIIEAINENSAVIITGETGSGKTTQVPQFLYEAGYAEGKMIGVTEPRRVAAISMSKRVAEEMNLSEKEVSYLIRFEGNATSQTKIKFMTDGVLLKEIQSDFLLKKYSVIILDEAHERSVYTDILIGFLTRIVSLRSKRGDPLKMIIMSATLRVDDFVSNPKLFKVKPPVINVESRQYPVTVHFNRRTNEDYVKEALRKTVKIHTQLPDGGILIFLTGQREVNHVVRKLRKAFPFRKKKGIRPKETDKKAENVEAESDQDSDTEFFARRSRRKLKGKSQVVELPRISLNAYAATPTDGTRDDLMEMAGDGSEDDHSDDEDDGMDLSGVTNVQPLWALPLYSLLSSEKQAKVFKPPPEGCRLCVVSTNVAETSLTIPNVKYVVDSGRCKMRLYDKITGVSTYKITYASKAAANQRAGRAGRVGPGHCYRLYSSAVFNDQFEAFSEPEIRRKPADDLLLQLKSMHIDNVVNFPFPTNPGDEQLKAAERRLCLLGALKSNSLSEPNSYLAKITNLGQTIAAFPVVPRYGKILALSHQHNLYAYTICIVAALSVQELLVDSFAKDSKLVQMRRYWAGTGNSLFLGDPMILLRSVGGAEHAASKGQLTKFCEEYGLREKAAIEVRKLRQQLTNEILLHVSELDLTVDPEMPPPNDMQAKLLRQLILAGMVDQVARKFSSEEMNQGEGRRKLKYAYKTLEMEDPVFMHSSSVLRKESPEWIVYQEVYETNKIYIRGVTAIDPEWLPTFAPDLCNMNEPLVDPPPWYDEEAGEVMCYMTGTFGPGGWELPKMKLTYPKNVDGVRWFARFLLEGKVFPKLKRFVKSLLTTPRNISASWAKILPRIEAITKPLLSKGVMSREKLKQEWLTDEKFLLGAYQMWLPKSASGLAASIWPPL
ncbi:probable ATP-dependent RNA helicase kurz [Belonocnema kinseyi]|uniref:probable ATP-dependent RNA helicase kurz n=1 Tax=Belonocnema kinseyi TaxID=2817044 RepID=UPI00143E0B71|nr:probable ATP-dependent RNA helicase kurz [Belonocnema kinseyi]XP_033224204.1 probable ATP-dependent RNA helicase kurz [Belonocnema kinseyi]